MALPSALSVAPLNAAPASPRFPGSAATRSVQLLKAVGSPNNQSICYMTITKQVCSNVDALLLKDWTTSSTYDLALAGKLSLVHGRVNIRKSRIFVQHGTDTQAPGKRTTPCLRQITTP